VKGKRKKRGTRPLVQFRRRCRGTRSNGGKKKAVFGGGRVGGGGGGTGDGDQASWEGAEQKKRDSQKMLKTAQEFPFSWNLLTKRGGGKIREKGQEKGKKEGSPSV